MSIVDHISPVQFDNTTGCFSITMACRCDEGFVTKAEPTKQRDLTGPRASHTRLAHFSAQSVTEKSSAETRCIVGRFAVICPLRRVTDNVYVNGNISRPRKAQALPS
jgi:hypothetical protein